MAAVCRTSLGRIEINGHCCSFEALVSKSAAAARASIETARRRLHQQSTAFGVVKVVEMCTPLTKEASSLSLKSLSWDWMTGIGLLRLIPQYYAYLIHGTPTLR